MFAEMTFVYINNSCKKYNKTKENHNRNQMKIKITTTIKRSNLQKGRYFLLVICFS